MGCMFVRSIAGSISDSLDNDLESAQFVSYLSDGSTDSGIIEQEIIYIRYVKNGEVCTGFAGIAEPKTVDRMIRMLQKQKDMYSN